MDIHSKKKHCPSINDYYKAASRGDIPLQYQHGLSNYSCVQLGDERAYRFDVDIEEPGNHKEEHAEESLTSAKSRKQRKEEYAEANEVVGLNKIHEMEKMMREKLQQRTKTGPFQLRKTFKYFDRDASGGIDFSEFQLAMELMGFQFTEIQQLALFARYDESCAGEIDYNDFVEKVMESDFKIVKQSSAAKKNLDNMISSTFTKFGLLGATNAEEEEDSDSDDEEIESFRRREVKKMFDGVDSDGSEYIDKKEMSDLLRKLGKDFSRERVNEGFFIIDTDCSGHIEFAEFYMWFKRIHEKK
jgi:Ca2+-binding EF-hand superfamily protein